MHKLFSKNQYQNLIIQKHFSYIILGNILYYNIILADFSLLFLSS